MRLILSGENERALVDAAIGISRMQFLLNKWIKFKEKLTLKKLEINIESQLERISNYR